MTRISISGIHNNPNYPYWILKILELKAELPQKMMPYGMKIWEVNCL